MTIGCRVSALVAFVHVQYSSPRLESTYAYDSTKPGSPLADRMVERWLAGWRGLGLVLSQRTLSRFRPH